MCQCQAGEECRLSKVLSWNTIVREKCKSIDEFHRSNPSNVLSFTSYETKQNATLSRRMTHTNTQSKSNEIQSL